MINADTRDTIDKVAAIALRWLEDNDETALELDAEGMGNADSFGMHTLCTGITSLYTLAFAPVIVQPDYGKQQWFGIVAAQSAVWQRANRDEGSHTETDEGFGLHSLTMTFLRLYHECIQRRIIVPPTHINTPAIH